MPAARDAASGPDPIAAMGHPSWRHDWSSRSFHSKPTAASRARDSYPSRAIASRAFCVSTSREYSGRMRSNGLSRSARPSTAIRPAAMAPSIDHAARRLNPAPSPAAATISGDGVSPAANVAASGSPPGSAAATASAEAGRRSGSGSRHRRMMWSIAASIALTTCGRRLERSRLVLVDEVTDGGRGDTRVAR